jgi:hypothetical protein
MTSGDMSSPLPENAWQLTVNSTYQDVMKTFMNLVTASLVLPIFFVRNFLKVSEDEPIADYLRASAYLSWALLFLSLVSCMVFFWASAKYVKVISGGGRFELPWTEKSFETLRDWSSSESVIFFLAGLLTLGWYFSRLRLRKG